jgi:hypothetical protein
MAVVILRPMKQKESLFSCLQNWCASPCIMQHENARPKMGIEAIALKH